VDARDALRHGLAFPRKVKVRLVGGGSVLAWVYVMNDLPADAPIIESGDWIAYRKAGYRHAEADAT